MHPIHDIVSAVADANGQSHTDLPPLLDAIDPDALVAFVDSADDDAELSFDYCDRRVVVSGTGEVETHAL